MSNLTRVTLASYAEACKLLVAGNKTRTFASTRMNEQSSRSHSVFTLHITTTYVDSTKTTTARLNLVDLAGSENQKSAGTTGDRLKEGANINKSLSTLSQVIAALSKKSVHIPCEYAGCSFFCVVCFCFCFHFFSARKTRARTLLTVLNKPYIDTTCVFLLVILGALHVCVCFCKNFSPQQ